MPLVTPGHKHKKSEGAPAGVLRGDFEGLNSHLITQTVVPTKSKVLSLNTSKSRVMPANTIPYEDSATGEFYRGHHHFRASQQTKTLNQQPAAVFRRDIAPQERPPSAKKHRSRLHDINFGSQNSSSTQKINQKSFKMKNMAGL